MVENKIVGEGVEAEGGEVAIRKIWQKPRLEVKPLGETAGPQGSTTDDGGFVSS